MTNKFKLEKIDLTLHFLPDGKRLNMDVKFPLNHYEKYLSSEIESEKQIEKKHFYKMYEIELKRFPKGHILILQVVR